MFLVAGMHCILAAKFVRSFFFNDVYIHKCDMAPQNERKVAFIGTEI